VQYVLEVLSRLGPVRPPPALTVAAAASSSAPGIFQNGSDTFSAGNALALLLLFRVVINCMRLMEITAT